MGAKNGAVHLQSLRSYEAAAQASFDQPLASRFDETDCVVYFDDVKVPWERMFVRLVDGFPKSYETPSKPTGMGALGRTQ